MKQPHFLISFLLLFSLIFHAASEAQTIASVKPNIVIIFADDMGYGDVSCLNPEARTYTPHIDALAQEGIRFTNAHASASVCTPSRYGLLTGRYAWKSESGGGVGDGFGEPVIEGGRRTIASLLKDAGYRTACIGKWHLGLRWQTRDGANRAAFNAETGLSNVDYIKKVTNGPNDYGFDYSFIHPASLDMPPYVFLRNHVTIDPQMRLTSDVYAEKLDDTRYEWDRKHTRDGDVYWEKMVWWRRGEISNSFRVENCLSEIVTDGLSFIENHVIERPSEPFFLYLPLTGPHTPWMPTDQFKDKSSIGTYGDFIMQIDDAVGQITRALKRSGVDDNTIIIFSSDNGAYWPQSEINLHGHNSNWNARGQKGDIWDGGHRIPLIISWPAEVKKRIVYDHLVSLTDLFATFSDLTDQRRQKNSGEDSFSFLHVLRGDSEKITRRDMIHQSSRGMYSIRKDRWKFIDGLGSGGFTAPAEMDSLPGGGTGQLYHVENDREESTNLFLRYPDKVEQLRKELRKQIYPRK